MRSTLARTLLRLNAETQCVLKAERTRNAQGECIVLTIYAKLGKGLDTMKPDAICTLCNKAFYSGDMGAHLDAPICATCMQRTVKTRPCRSCGCVTGKHSKGCKAKPVLRLTMTGIVYNAADRQWEVVDHWSDGATCVHFSDPDFAACTRYFAGQYYKIGE
jgi:hypothetical protein